MTEFKELSSKDSDAVERWLRFRASLVKQRADLARCRTRIAMAECYRKRTRLESKEGALLLSWMAIQEARAYKQLRLLPGAIRYSSHQARTALEEIGGQE